MNLTHADAAHILSIAGLRMPPLGENQPLRQLCWRVLYAWRGECVAVHHCRGQGVWSLETGAMDLAG